MATEFERIEPTLGTGLVQPLPRQAQSADTTTASAPADSVAAEGIGANASENAAISSRASTVAPSDKYKKHRWKFLVFGAVSGVLMGVYSPGPATPGGWLSDLVGGAILWYLLWWLWAWSKRRKDRSNA